ncbi:unnamed protein product [Lepeophtheirus salmonis]|uniref:(salmon louse) hypothetical protein n=1 Tax=Lepeophtheirus salmonis TaxID=72036 RepID=A0A7R8HDB4_LEPSM|nr:unnamed protein product [Lepeophtheirus salmonis]CAF3006444.1 unnamed protein product [Lepeophtheirus salmonis]
MLVLGLKKSIDANPTTPLAKLTKIRNMSKTTTKRVFNVDLGNVSWVRAVKHLLTEDKKATSNTLLTGEYLNFFPDENIFTFHCLFNCLNDRWTCSYPLEIYTIMKTKKPAGTMILDVISSEGTSGVPEDV